MFTSDGKKTKRTQKRKSLKTSKSTFAYLDMVESFVRKSARCLFRRVCIPPFAMNQKGDLLPKLADNFPFFFNELLYDMCVCISGHSITLHKGDVKEQFSKCVYVPL